MKLKMKLMAAAVALTAASGVNAAMDNFSSGNSSLAFIALDSSNATTGGGNTFRGSVMMDLDFNLNSFLPASVAAPGTKIEWLFGSNQLKVNGVVQTGGNYNWSSAFGTFNGGAALSQTKWGVIVGDTSADGGTNLLRIASTVTPGTTQAAMNAQDLGSLYNISTLDALYTTNNANLGGTDGSATVLSTATAYVGKTTNFGTTGNWGGNTSFTAYSNVGTTADFFMLDDSNHVSTTASKYAGTFNYAAGVLTYQVAAPIPEPETYALLLAGLGMLGFMGRRRLNNRV